MSAHRPAAPKGVSSNLPRRNRRLSAWPPPPGAAGGGSSGSHRPSPGSGQVAELTPVYAAAIRTLTWGSRLGAALLLVGLAVALARREPLNHQAEPFAEVLPAVLDGRAAGIVDLAILWLMITPVVTVVVVAIGFLRLGDRRYALLSLLVLAILGVSIGLALRR